MSLLILDNYDSFTYNLVHLVEKVCDLHIEVAQNDKITVEQASHFKKILLAPGPGLPSEAGIMPALIKELGSSRSILGVCLGLQAIGECYGATLKNLEEVVHGRATPVEVKKRDVLFDSCPSIFLAGRYHSWVIDKKDLPSSLEITAVDEQGNIMAARHREFDVRGVQFHPESILSEHGETIIGNWLRN
jgi:anthranilate synthase component 2